MKVKDEKIGRLERKIKILKIISTIVCLIGAVLVTLFIKLNFVIFAVITALITFGVSLGFDAVRKILNMTADKMSKSINKGDNGRKIL